jgi:hypothetical protein
MASATRELPEPDAKGEVVVSSGAPTPGVRRISIGSYNIHSCVGLDRKCSPSRIADVLKELDCDI